MSYAAVDATIASWAADNRLTTFTKYQDVEVRSFEIVNEAGDRWQLWIDPPAGDAIDVHLWDYRKRRADWAGKASTLKDMLNEAIATARDWMAEKGQASSSVRRWRSR